MLELGKKSKKLHRELFQQFLHYKIQAVFALGVTSQSAAAAFSEYTNTDIYHFQDHRELAKKLKGYSQSGDIILLKGSRGMQMEQILAHL
jgi:UDP-N-acetylmuramoyl-tripeptide--D-alanyl-D-alanine ligase